MTHPRTAERRPPGTPQRTATAPDRPPESRRRRPASARALTRRIPPAPSLDPADRRGSRPEQGHGERPAPAAAPAIATVGGAARAWRPPWWVGWLHVPLAGLAVLGFADLWAGRVPGTPEFMLVGTVLGLLVLGIFSLRSQALGPAFCGPRPARGPMPVVALTFDDGPDPQTTPHLLAALGGARATFCVVGEQARAHPRLIADIRARGHGLAAHGERHSWRDLLTVGRARRLVADGAASLAGPGLRPTPFFRPPYGIVTPPLLVAVRAAGLTLTGWSRRSLDTLGFRSPERFAHRLAARVRNGDIVLLHDATVTLRHRPAAGRAMVATLVAELRGRGFAFVTLEDLYGHEDPAGQA